MALSSPKPIGRDLDMLAGLSLAELKGKWRTLYRSEPPSRISRALLVRAIAFKTQEKASRGLKPAIRKKLAAIATGGARSGGTASESICIKPGTRLVREWNGEVHQVTVAEGAFVWKDDRYRSLSAIARAITGTRWNGHVFFGLKTRNGSVAVHGRSNNA